MQILFLTIAVLVEILVVLYAIRIGVKDQMPLQWSFIFPGTASHITLSISPLFHLVPIAVILTLAASWTYLRKQVLIRPSEPQKGTPNIGGRSAKGQRRTLAERLGFARRKKTATLGRGVRFRRTNIRSTLIVLGAFSALLILISLFAFPWLIYNAIATAYENNPSVLNFVKGVGATVTPIGKFLWPINNVLLGAAPGFRNFVLALGGAIAPLANMDNDGKYLVFQNAAAWISTLGILFYGRFGRRSLRQTRK
jgi:hypothetical protein